MNLLVSASSIHRMLRSIEWSLIGIFILFTPFSHIWNISAAVSAQLTVLLIALMALSLFFPVGANSWVRRSYVLSGIAITLAAISQGIPFELFLYLYMVKSCFLLSRRQVLLITGLAVIAASVISTLALPKIVQVQSFWAIDLTSTQDILQFAFERLATNSSAGIFTIPLCFMIVAEQNSRHKAETLAEQVRGLVADLERTRIARDIHDSLGHTLTALKIHLSLTQKSFERGSNETLEVLKTAKLLADQAIEEVQQTLWMLRQPAFNLNQALTILIEQARQNSALNVQWNINLPPLPLHTNHHLYCIVKEGLMNVQKHANASQIRLRGVSVADQILLELEDNGQGFDTQISHSGLGLKGIVERVQALQGQITIQSALGSGTQIHIVIPYDSTAAC